MRFHSSSRMSAKRRVESRRESALGFLAVKRIFFKVMAATMGCFFCCFRVKDSSNSNSRSSSSAVSANETLVARNRSPLSSLLHAEDHDGTPMKGKEEEQDEGTPVAKLGFSHKELKDEAEFLKACGTLTETPLEIRKVAEETKYLSSTTGEDELQKFRSWLPNRSIEKLNLEKQQDQSSTPIKVRDEWGQESASLEHTPSSSIEGSGIQNAAPAKVFVSGNDTPKSSLLSTNFMDRSVPGKNKSVHFNHEPVISSVSTKGYSSDIASENSKQSGLSGNARISKLSPFPTPLKLTDEMQTPGTVFPAYLDDMGQDKTNRIRSQFVYPVDPTESLRQWDVLKDKGSESNYLSDQTRCSTEQADFAESQSGVEKEIPDKKELNLEASLSPWLRVAPSNPYGNSQHNGSTAGENIYAGRTPGDRPILGMVAAHWNDESSRISPKWWDGNGIPNSTNKYKEDQKVNWHATPFEERLEKALSDETFIPQRNQSSGTPPLDFNETEESDTALSRLQSSHHTKSVVSF